MAKRKASKKVSKKKAPQTKKQAPSVKVLIEDPESNLATLPNISAQDIKNLDTDKLRETMLQGFYVLEGALFSQAGEEYNRINKLRQLIKTIEEDILDKEKLEEMSDHQKIRLYQALLGNQSNSLTFLNQLHQNVAGGLDTLSKIESMKKKPNIGKGNDSAQEDADVEKVKKLLMEAMQKKVKEQS